MLLISPEDRAQIWREATIAGPEARASQRRALAAAVFQTVGSSLNLYSDEYASACYETFDLLDASGLIGRDALREAFEEVDETPGTPQLFASAVARFLREAADVPHLDDEQQKRAADLAEFWQGTAVDAIAPDAGDEGETISVAEVAAIFEVTPQAVYKWIEKGAIDYEQTPGGSYRIPFAQFEGATHYDRPRARRLQHKLARDRAGRASPSRDEVVKTIRQRRRSSQ